MRPKRQRWVLSAEVRGRLRAAADRAAADRGRVSRPGLAAAGGVCLAVGLGLSALATAPVGRSGEPLYTVYVGQSPVAVSPAGPPPPEPEPEVTPAGPDSPPAIPSEAPAQVQTLEEPRPEVAAVESVTAPVAAPEPSSLDAAAPQAPPTAVAQARAPEGGSPPVPAPAGGDDARSNYWDSVRCAVAEHLRYPSAARRRGIEGAVLLHIGVDGGGRLQKAGVIEASDRALASAAVAAARRAAPFPPPGAAAPGGGEAVVAIRFRLE